MPLSASDFWQLLAASRVVSSSAAPKLRERFVQAHSAAAQSDVKQLAKWLVAQGVISRYQAKVLLAGHAGPFVYGDYIVYERHTEGRLQGTFRALHPATRHRVLLLFHTGQIVQNRQWWSFATEQAGTLAQAVNPHLSRLYHLCDIGQFKFTVLEDLQGESAAMRLAQGKFSWPVACRMIRQTASGLARLFELGQLHGAIRPNNLWIDGEENAKLLLPPLARSYLAIPGPLDFDAADPAGELLREADYAAPEFAHPRYPTNARTEIYALGCTLFELLSGRPPYTGSDVVSKLASHAGEPVPSLQSLGVPAQVDRVLAGMMAKDPVRRFQQPLQVADALATLLSHLEPTQLNWPASPAPAKLPEYENWLQPSVAPATAARPPIVSAKSEPSPRQSDTAPLTMKVGELAVQPAVAVSTVASRPAAGAQAVAERIDKVAPIFTATPSAIAPDAEIPRISIVAAQNAVCATPVAARIHDARARHNRRVLSAAGAAGILAFVGLIVWAVLNKADDQQPTADGRSAESVQADAVQRDAASPPESAKDAAQARSKAPVKMGDAAAKSGDETSPAIVADDGNTLWVSPTGGRPRSLSQLPPGLQAILFLRPAELLRQGEGERALTALGPDVEAARQTLESILGAPLSEVEQLTIGWIEQFGSDASTAVVPMYSVRFAEPPDASKLVASWGHKPEAANDEKVFVTPQGLYAYLPLQGDGELLLGSHEKVQEAARPAGPPPLRRDIEKLLLTSDADRLATLVWIPNSVAGSNASPSGEVGEKLLAWARVFFGDDIRAAAISVHLADDDLFLELRLVGPLDRQPADVARDFKDRLARLPEAVENYVFALDMQPYGKRILMRLPQMLRLLDEFARSGAEGDQAIVRSYLPAAAAHNLLLATELALAESDSAAPAGGTSDPGRTSGPRSAVPIADRLQQKATLRFVNEPLDRALQLLADDLGIKIEILGSDLQLDGITKNQAIRDLSEIDKPGGEILRNIMLKANPDGKLVYVVKSAAAGGGEVLQITTRAAAAKRGDRLPPELASPTKK